jgi:DNA-binding response OmpR family regulator
MRLLLVEDDASLADAVLAALRETGHAVDHLADGELADWVLKTQDYDLVLLDLTLPRQDGLQVLRRLRDRRSKIPVLVLTARDALKDRVGGLDMGADDYLTKPFALAELEARVRALLRRSQNQTDSIIHHGDLNFDTVARCLTLAGQAVELPRRELCLLEILLGHRGQVVGKEQIAEHLFSFDDEAGLNAIEIYIHRLRKRLGPAGLVIRTVRGMGYLLEEP